MECAKKRKAEITTIQEVTFEKHLWGKKHLKRCTNSNQDVRAPDQRTQVHDFDKIHESVKQSEKKTGKQMGLKFILPHEKEETASPEPDSIVENTNSKWGLISPINIHPVSLHEIAHRAKRVKKRLFAFAVDQQKSRTWYDVRQPRITASQCKRCVMKSNTSPTKAIGEVLLYHANCQTRAMKEGIEWEPKIIAKFTNDTGHQVKKTGFLISETHPFLGASPDGMTDKGNLVEVKKVTSREGENLQDTMCRLYIYKREEDQLLINKNHKYFYQIQ